ALMASPLSKGLIAGAIGESGAAIKPTFEPVGLAEADKTGIAFATAAKADSLAALRAMPADAVLAVQGGPRFPITIDGYFLQKTVAAIFAAGEQARVPLLAGWNSHEGGVGAFGRGNEPTPEAFEKTVRAAFPDHGDEVLKVYPATTPDEIIEAAAALAGDRFIAFSTWKWIDLHARTGGKPTYRYFYSRPRPAMNPGKGTQGPARGAAHSAEIEYAMGNLATNEVYAWTDDDRKVSETMHAYFANFVKTGDPNGATMPKWAAVGKGDDVMHLDVQTRAESDKTRARYLALDRIYAPSAGSSK